MEYFQSLHTILKSTAPEDKIARFHRFYKAYRSYELERDDTYAVHGFDTPSYSGYCRIVSPQAVPKRKNMAGDAGRIAMLHAVAHIEYAAIDLALDAAYRFKGLPEAYYDDWLKVADDEIRHFEMIETLLRELGSRYGALEVHNGLFEASQRTQHSFLERMAVVPRYLEANGLDATPQILKKLERLNSDAMLERIKATLHVILDEEVDHVAKGDRWFAYACEREGVAKSIYFEIIEKHYPGTFKRARELNVSGRLEAGFTCKELKQMAANTECFDNSGT